MTMKPKYALAEVRPLAETGIVDIPRYRCRSLPAAGAILRASDGEEKQLETRRGTQTRTTSLTTLYTIGYYRRDRADRSLGPDDLPDEAMGFFSQRVRDEALAMLAKQTGIVRTAEGGAYHGNV